MIRIFLVLSIANTDLGFTPYHIGCISITPYHRNIDFLTALPHVNRDVGSWSRPCIGCNVAASVCRTRRPERARTAPPPPLGLLLPPCPLVTAELPRSKQSQSSSGAAESHATVRKSHTTQMSCPFPSPVRPGPCIRRNIPSVLFINKKRVVV